MLTDDKRIDVSTAISPSNLVLLPASWSIFNASTPQLTARLAKHLFNMPTSKHTSLMVCREKRKNRVEILKGLNEMVENGFEYLETINIKYEKPNSCSNNGLLPISETALLFYKGVPPDPKNTRWFNEEYSNATNFWDLGVSQDEPAKHSYYQKFSWELQFILKTISDPIESKRFIYGLDLSPSEANSLFLFCKTFDFECQIITNSYEKQEKLLKQYNEST